MPDLYPLLLQPEFHERVWGTRDLKPFYAREVVGGPIGEAWLTGDKCTVANGTFAGRNLADLAQEFGARFLGDAGKDASRFPLLIKFLFPTEKLSVQVHPDDEGARAVGQACGKTECWYVLAAEPGAQVALGLNSGVTHEQVAKAIEATELEPLMNWMDVKP